MAYPTPPAKAYSYTALEQAAGDGQIPGQELDVDLGQIIAFLDEFLTFTKNVLRSDGALANGIVKRESLSTEFLLGFGAPSVWMTATDYVVTDTVFNSGGFYICREAHTSGTFSTDLAAGRWELLVDLTANGAALTINNLNDLDSISTARSNLGLVIGTNVQAYNAALTSLAALGTAGDKGLYATAEDTFAEYDLTAFGRTLAALADAAAARTAIELEMPDDDDLTNSPDDVARRSNVDAYVQTYADAQDLGIGQTTQDVTGSRTLGVAVQNTTGKPIMVFIRVSNENNQGVLEVSTDNVTFVSLPYTSVDSGSSKHDGSITWTIPPGHWYRATGGAFAQFIELR